MSDDQAFCTRCGTALHGARFCPECGAATANTGQETTAANGGDGGVATMAPATASTETRRVVPVAPPRTGPNAPRSRRPMVIAAAGALLLLGLVAGAVAVFAGGGSRTVTRTVVTTPPPTTASTTPSQTTSVGPVTRGEARALANAYAGAYSAQRISTLREMLAPSFHRKNAGEPAQGKPEALATYASQFNTLTNPRYTLSGMAITTGQRTASVTADYQITSDAGTVKGAIVIEMGRVGSKLMITYIKATPQTRAGSGGSTGGGSSSGSGSTGSSPSGGTQGNDGSSSGGSSGAQSGSDGGGLGWYGNELPIAPVPNLY